MNKKLRLRIEYPCGKVNIRSYNTRKSVDNAYRLLVNDKEVYDGHKYVKGVKVTKIR